MIAGIEISSDGKTTYAFADPNSSGQSESGFIIKSMDGGKNNDEVRWTNYRRSICK